MVMELDRADERPDVQMTRADKDAINTFSKHLGRRNELRVRLVRRKKLLDLHEDASEELELLDDDAEVHLAVGDVFVQDGKDQVEAELEETIGGLKKDVRECEEEMKELEGEMTRLKASLYAKFGKTINLEE